MQKVLDHIAQGVGCFDAGRNLQVWNARYEEILQFPEGMLRTGLPIEEMTLFLAQRGDYGPGDPHEVAGRRIALLFDGRPKRIGIKVQDRKIYEVLTRPTGDGGVVITYTDVTEREQVLATLEDQRDELARVNRQKDLLLSVVAHDLRSPFNVLVSLSDLMVQLGDGLTRRKAQEYAAAINESASSAYALLENLLDWSRLEMDQATFLPVEVRLRTMVDDAIRPSLGAAGLKGVRIRNRTADWTVRADRHGLSTILRNLVNNAVKYSNAGGIVDIAAGFEGGDLMVIVSDNGVGMDAARIEGLFRDGGAGSRAGTGGESGTGLGFLLCRQFVERHGGTIHVDSREGRGTTVRFGIPQSASGDLTGHAHGTAVRPGLDQAC